LAEIVFLKVCVGWSELANLSIPVLVCRKKLGFHISPQPATLRGAELPHSHAARGNERTYKTIARSHTPETVKVFLDFQSQWDGAA